jgi:hypothetical protein
MRNPLKQLRQEIDAYMRDQPGKRGPLTMQDVYESALECQARINALGYEWDNQRGLWRAPTTAFYRPAGGPRRRGKP